jgi:hypothetical protein
MAKPVQMHIGNNNQTPFLPKMITFISTSGNFWINQVLRARKATFSHLFRLAGNTSMHAAENLTGLYNTLSGPCTPSSANAARAQHVQHN